MMRQLWFVHVPKTAGTSFADMFACCFAGKGWDLHQIDEIIPQAARPQYTLFQVHLGFPELRDHGITPDQCFTFLRDPVQRAISNHSYAANLSWLPGGWFHQTTLTAKKFSLEEILRSDDPVLKEPYQNLQTRFLSSSAKPGEPVTETHLKEALENLARFQFCGLTHRSEESLELCARKFGFPKPEAMTRSNTQKLSPPEVNSTLGKILARENELDRELLAAAVPIFEQNKRKIIFDSGPGIQPNLQVLKLVDEWQCDISRALPGSNWHKPDWDGRCWGAWSGPARKSTLLIPLRKGAGTRILTVAFRGYPNQHSVEGLQLEFNGHTLPARFEKVDGEFVHCSEIPEEWIPPGISTLTVAVPSCVHPAKTLGNRDHRLVGVQLSKLSFSLPSPIAERGS